MVSAFKGDYGVIVLLQKETGILIELLQCLGIVVDVKKHHSHATVTWNSITIDRLERDRTQSL